MYDLCPSQVQINTAISVIAGVRTKVLEYYCLTLSKNYEVLNADHDGPFDQLVLRQHVIGNLV